MNPILLQTMYYGIVMLLTIALMAMLLRGFLTKYLRVKASFGKLAMVEIKKVHDSDFAVGLLVDGSLIFKSDKKKGRVCIENITFKSFTRKMGINWFVVDDETSAIIQPDMSVVSGFDRKKFDDLFERCIKKPEDNKILIAILLLGIIVLLAVVGDIFLDYNNKKALASLTAKVAAMKSGVVLPASPI